ncbi:MAG: exo-alpha-sialidase [Alistipes sp.]|nr:exo-alpha-sialidase [Alistipes sp.]
MLNITLFAIAFVAISTSYAREIGPYRDPVLGSKQRPDPAMEIVSVDTSPAKRYMLKNLNYGMTIGIEQTKGGRIWCCWVGGGDNSKAYFLLAWSDDGGESWSDTKAVLDPHDKRLPENRRTIVGNLWCDPDGRLWLFYDLSMTYYDGRSTTWATVCDNPDAAHPRWSEPQFIGLGVSLNKPTVLSNGDWVLPSALWGRHVIDIILDKGRKQNIYHDAYHEYDSMRGANVFISPDKGRTWLWHKGVFIPDTNHEENMVVELSDGTLQMTARSRGKIFRSLSHDKGRTWGDIEEWQPHVSARHFIRRLSDGRLLMIRHGMTDERTPKRSHLRAFVSSDDGKTWQGGLLLDERVKISYPDGFESEDGYIYISYDRCRSTEGEIWLARFTIDDVLQGKVSSPRGVLRKLIHRPGKAKGSQAK